jgi:hypothetical protein
VRRRQLLRYYSGLYAAGPDGTAEQVFDDVVRLAHDADLPAFGDKPGDHVGTNERLSRARGSLDSEVGTVKVADGSGDCSGVGRGTVRPVRDVHRMPEGAEPRGLLAQDVQARLGRQVRHGGANCGGNFRDGSFDAGRSKGLVLGEGNGQVRVGGNLAGLTLGDGDDGMFRTIP